MSIRRMPMSIRQVRVWVRGVCVGIREMRAWFRQVRVSIRRTQVGFREARLGVGEERGSFREVSMVIARAGFPIRRPEAEGRRAIGRAAQGGQTLRLIERRFQPLLAG